MTKKEEAIKQVNDLLQQLYESLDNTKATRSQEEIMYKLTKLTRQIFQKGFDGMMYANIWFS